MVCVYITLLKLKCLDMKKVWLDSSWRCLIMEIMAKASKEMLIYMDDVLPWVDHYEYVDDNSPLHYIIFKKDTPEEIKLLFKRIESKLPSTKLRP